MPSFFSSLTPAQWIIVAIVLIAIVSGLKRLGRKRIEQITCPSCQKTMDRGRRVCPFCKEPLVKY